jgi:putative transposase
MLTPDMRKHSGGTVSDLKIHLVLVTKYRRNVITRLVLERLEQILAATALKWNCELQQCNGERNHIHMIIEHIPNMNLADFAGNLKTVSSRLIRKEFPAVKAAFRKPVLWKIGYYVGSCGEASLEAVKRYIEQQDPPD